MTMVAAVMVVGQQFSANSGDVIALWKMINVHCRCTWTWKRRCRTLLQFAQKTTWARVPVLRAGHANMWCSIRRCCWKITQSYSAYIQCRTDDMSMRASASASVLVRNVRMDSKQTSVRERTYTSEEVCICTAAHARLWTMRFILARIICSHRRLEEFCARVCL